MPTMIRMTLSLLAALPLLAACGAGTSSSGSAAGKGVLFGKVSRGSAGACMSQGPCTTPASGVILSFSQGGAPPVKATTDAKGHYRVQLPAGRYSVSGPQPLKPKHVDVQAGSSQRVDFSGDSKVS
jgi:hypothetical protein